MNGEEIEKVGIPRECYSEAIDVIRLVAYGRLGDVRKILKDISDSPEKYLNRGPAYEQLAKALIKARADAHTPPEYQIWGADGIASNAVEQMTDACRVPNARAAALMPDAHLGYGLPIGGVLGLENAVCPYAVGFDIACRMKLSILDIWPESLEKNKSMFSAALRSETAFGTGAARENLADHPVLDKDWGITKVTKEKKDRAHEQLGSSGSGNHFVEFGVIYVSEELGKPFDIPKGEYVALMSHSGSRNAGHSVCKHYSKIAESRLPRRYKDLGKLAWLDMDSEEGQEYWAAMNLMGEYAAANHDVIHDKVTEWVGGEVVGVIENHHNFAWKEEHQGRELYVHRKGATPAAAGELGVIPGSMEQPAYVVLGLGNPASLNSASHGAGRRMSRKVGNATYSREETVSRLKAKGITVLGCGADESPGCYKPIDEVMEAQQDLVTAVGKFQPRIVMMDGTGSKAED